MEVTGGGQAEQEAVLDSCLNLCWAVMAVPA